MLIDDPVNLLVVGGEATQVAFALGPLGHRQVCVSLGEAALREIAGTDFSLVLLDGRPADMAALELARRIRGGVRCNRVPIVFLIAAGAPEWPIEAAYRLGPVDHLPAPVNAVVLRAKVALLVELGRKTEALSRLEGERRVDDGLRASEQRLRATLASIGDAVIETDPDARVTSLNGVAQALTGWTQSEAVGVPLCEVFRIVKETPQPGDHNPALQALSGGALVGPAGHTILIAKDGTERSIDDSAAPIRGANGQTLGAVLVFRDMTEKRRIEADRQRFVSLAENSTGFISVFDLDGTPVLVNPAGRDMVGLDSLEQALQKTAIEYFFPEDQPFMRDEFFPRVMREGRAEMEARFRHFKTGDVLWMIYNLFILRDEHGRASGLAAVSRNVTARKHAEMALRASEERLRLATDAAGLGVWMWDITEDRVTWENERPYELFGIPRSEAPLSAARFLAEFVHPDDAEAFRQAIAVTLDTGVPLRFEGRFYRHTDGELRWTEFTGKLQTTAHGSPSRLLGTAADITERKRAEESLRWLAAELSEADRRKTEFLATLAHELRNPLAPLCNGLEVLRLASGNPVAAAAARDMMARQLAHMVRLVDDLLDVARITRGKVELKKARVDLRNVVASAIETSLPLIEAGGHELIVKLDEAPMLLDIDPTRIAQVVSNLLNNAAKYTPAGGRIELSARCQGAGAVVCVTDTGVGIPAESLASVFDMFAQVGRNMDRAQGGLGIGLTLVSRLVELHGGTVVAASPGAGQGSTFIVELPLAREALAQQV